MSFLCQICGEPQPRGATPTKVITEVRQIFVGVLVSKDGRQGSTKWREEIVKEVSACSSCAQNPGKPKVVEWVGEENRLFTTTLNTL